jgi:hypothetical protein
MKPAIYVGFYSSLFNVMRENNVRRIFAMGTISIPQPDDHFSIFAFLIVLLVMVVVYPAYRTIRSIGTVFEEKANGLDWTVYRIAGIPGGHDEQSWKRDRDDGDSFEGSIGAKGWSGSQKRAALARWLVDAVEDGKPQWIGKMPAVSRLTGSKRKST